MTFSDRRELTDDLSYKSPDGRRATSDCLLNCMFFSSKSTNKNEMLRIRIPLNWCRCPLNQHSTYFNNEHNIQCGKIMNVKYDKCLRDSVDNNKQKDGKNVRRFLAQSKSQENVENSIPNFGNLKYEVKQ